MDMTPLNERKTPLTDAASYLHDQRITSCVRAAFARVLEQKLDACREALDKFAAEFTDVGNNWSGTEHSKPARIYSCWRLARETLEQTK